MGFSIREAEPGDAEAICALVYALFAERPDTLLLAAAPRTPEQQREVVRAHRDAANSVFLIAVEAGEVIGHLRFAGCTRERCTHSGVISMAVLRARRGCGVGSALLAVLFEWIEAHPSVWRAELEVLSNNPRARALYARMGFVQEGVRRAAVALPGELLDSVAMARLWPPKPAQAAAGVPGRGPT